MVTTIDQLEAETKEQPRNDLDGNHTMTIKGSVAVITGAAGGIGRALALEMAKRKATGLALVDRSETVHQVAKAVNEFAGATLAFGYSGDVTEAAFRAQVYGEMAERKGVVNICVPAAGITRDGL